MKYPKVADLVAGTATHLKSNPTASERFNRPPYVVRTVSHPISYWMGEEAALTSPHRSWSAKLADAKRLTSAEAHEWWQGLYRDSEIVALEDITSGGELPRAVARFRNKKKNPALRDNPTPEIRQAAIEKFEQFHRYPPTKITEFAKGFAIPHEVVCAGKAKWTTYRSGKVDPATLKKPSRPVDYIHEHNAGVHVYFPPDAPELEDLEIDAEPTPVPRAYYAVEALVKLGDSLGFCIRGDDGDDEFEAEAREELYCVPDGTCLLIVARRRDVVAMIWGGALGVFGRGIDG